MQHYCTSKPADSLLITILYVPYSPDLAPSDFSKIIDRKDIRLKLQKFYYTESVCRVGKRCFSAQAEIISIKKIK